MVYRVSKDRLRKIEESLVEIQAEILIIKGEAGQTDPNLCTCPLDPKPHYHCSGCNAIIDEKEYLDGEICDSCYENEQERLALLGMVTNETNT